MRILPVVCLCGAIALIASAHWILAICLYLAGGAARLRHLSARPTAAGSIASRTGTFILWPLTLIEDITAFWKPDRFLIFVPSAGGASIDRDHQFAARSAAISNAASQAAKLGQDVEVMDQARYVAQSECYLGAWSGWRERLVARYLPESEYYRIYVVSPDGTVQVRMHWGEGGLSPVRGFPAPAQLPDSRTSL